MGLVRPFLTEFEFGEQIEFEFGELTDHNVQNETIDWSLIDQSKKSWMWGSS